MTFDAIPVGAAVFVDANVLVYYAQPHPTLGPFGHIRTPSSFSGDAVAAFRAPAMGEHNAEIALQVAGLPAERYAALQALGVFQ